MAATINTTDQDLYTAIRSFILGLIPDAEVFQGIDNGVPLPIDGFIVMTIISHVRLATNIDTWGINTHSAQQSIRIRMQIDCYGEISGDWASIIATKLRDVYGTDNMPATVQPLHADEPEMIPLINDEAQYEQRWMVSTMLQYNPIVTTPGDTFDTAVVGTIINVDP